MAAPQCSFNKDCSKFFKSILLMKINHLQEIADHIASGNCSHPPLLKDFIFDQNPVEGSTPLLLACQQGELDSVKHIVESWGVDVRAPAKYHSNLSEFPQFYVASFEIDSVTPLFVAAFHGYDQIVRYLLEKGADVSAKTSSSNSVHNGLTPLYGTVYEWYFFSSKKLLELQEERSDIVRILLEFGADPIADSFRPSDERPMWMEKRCGVDTTITLINHGIDLKRRNQPTCETLLHHWAKCPHNSSEDDSLAIVSLLANKGADLLARDVEGFTPLLTAANHSNLKILDYLLARNDYSRTEKIEAMELAGAAILFEVGNALHFAKAFRYWRRAHHLRQMEIGASARKILGRKIGNNVEWNTWADLDQLEQHPEDYQIHILWAHLI